MLGGIIPLQIDPCKLAALPVLRHFVVRLKNREQMVGMTPANVFYSKVIHDQRELNWPPLVAPQPSRGRCLIVARRFQTRTQQIISEAPRLRQTIGATDDLEISSTNSSGMSVRLIRTCSDRSIRVLR